MSLQFDSDVLNLLPVNDSEPSPAEILLTRQFFGDEQTLKGINWSESAIIGVIFFIGALPEVDKLLQSVGVPTNPYILSSVKALCIIILYTLISWINSYQ